MVFAKTSDIGPLQLKNGFIMAPVKTAYGTPDGRVTERHLTYYDNLARGGAAMIILEPVAVTQSGREHPKQLAVHLPHSRESLARIVETLHARNTLACLNLNHAGRAANPKATGMPLKAPSPVTCPATGQTPEALMPDQIDAIIEGYRKAVEVARNAGFDAIEIQAGHGYLIQQFLSARTNLRDDLYGREKSLFLRQVFAAVRAERGTMAVLVRISGHDFHEDGFGPEENEIILSLAEECRFDAIHCGLGNACDTPPWYYSHMALPEQKQEDVIKAIRNKTKLPLIVAGRMGDPARIEKFSHESLADFIALGRPLVADPQFVNKLLQGKTDEITYCGYCLQGCLVNVKNGTGLGCLANPNVEKQPVSTDNPKHVAVIGGGPAGMSAATQLAKMGHDVALYEKRNVLGGQFDMAYQAPHKESMSKPLESLVRQTHRTVRSIHLNTEFNDIPSGNFDHYIVATGSRQRIPEIRGLNNQDTMTSLEFFEKARSVKGKRVLIIGAGMVGIEIAEILADDGFDVTITKRTGEIANDMELITKKLLMKRLEQKNNLVISPFTTLVEFSDDRVIYEQQGERGEWPAFDSVIIAAGMEPDNRLYQKLTEAGQSAVVVGDANQPEDIYKATRSGYEAAIQLG